MNRVAFQKWEATGNDFLFVDMEAQSFEPSDLSSHKVRQLCHRERGIGADGIVFYKTPGHESAAMFIINSDGSTGGMCGNALRCLALILLTATDQTDHRVRLTDRDVTVRVDSNGAPQVLMGEAGKLGEQSLFADLPQLSAVTGRSGHLLSFGNPHYVTPVEALPADWESLGQALQSPAHEALHTGGVNAGFVCTSPDRENIHELRVFERGAGATKSCGSGACAASAVLDKLLGLKPPHALRLPGGVLRIAREGRSFTLSGPANLEFSGSFARTAEGSWEIDP